MTSMYFKSRVRKPRRHKTNHVDGTKPAKSTPNWNGGAVHGTGTFALVSVVCELQKQRPREPDVRYTKWKCIGATHTLNMCPSGVAQAHCPSGQLGLRERERQKANEAWIGTRSHPSPTAMAMMAVFIGVWPAVWHYEESMQEVHHFKYQQSSLLYYFMQRCLLSVRLDLKTNREKKKTLRYLLWCLLPFLCCSTSGSNTVCRQAWKAIHHFLKNW